MSTSNRARRMAQHHLRHRADAELNLVPFIDILTVMVAFLLVYATQVEVIHNAKAIPLPESIARQQPHPTVVVTVTRSDIYVQGQRVVTIAQVLAETGNDIAPLRAALESPSVVGATTSSGDPAHRELTIMADKTLPYEVLKKVMSTCTGADYGHIALAVLEKEKPVAAGQLQAS
ncbi:MAG TPA: biopolymer transporter ExbD [Steroidobacteraceae bacterium]|jgi:biopolymer transport protein ExbD|nr:biopolymer transporter ExbD [Steroidobacteraceae bacterium]